MADLNARQKLFCEEYVKDCNGTQAVIRAGYSEKGARVKACNLLANINVKAHISELHAKKAKEASIDQEWVLEKFKEIAAISLKKNDKGKIDAHGAARALENIAKHLGFYEKDNKQLHGNSTIKIEIVDPKDE